MPMSTTSHSFLTLDEHICWKYKHLCKFKDDIVNLTPCTSLHIKVCTCYEISGEREVGKVKVSSPLHVKKEKGNAKEKRGYYCNKFSRYCHKEGTLI